ncbi:bi-domain-containing oxidoreductase [Methanobacterium oryzae]|uniref:bi-domain-containing oxidoreductase n=1 Tax=Methanobacterium oryzae TaxID=69540 RepID=UPI003D237716
MRQVFNHAGNIVVEDIPAPICGDNEILVSNCYSLISAGTEKSFLGDESNNLVSKIINNPELINKGIELIKKEGLIKSLELIKEQSIPLYMPLGYSSSGIVLQVGKKINDISVGDRVACAGAGYANHAEIISVPRNLVTNIPDDVDFDEAAFTTVGAIAMQGIRRAEAQIGDNVVVLGLGLLGQIACQILKAAGVHVIGIDTLEDRNNLALELGADECFIAGEDAVEKVIRSTGGMGADSVIIYAATKSSLPVKQAMEMARKKGKVVVVGDVGMEIDRSPFYEKELDFLISCSYGPGRYDKLYEEKGYDYPIGYVRWTENRNMQEFLKMLSEKRINVKKLINHVFELEGAYNAYNAFEAENRPIGVLFKYKCDYRQLSKRKVILQSRKSIENRINVAVIGTGSFAQAQHLPNLQKISDYNIKAIVSRTGSNAKRIAEQYGADYFTTDYSEVFQDESIDLIVITTRHNLHAPLIIEAANYKKDIFVEKPIAMSYEECEAVYNSVIKNDVNLTVGFNRRLSKLAQKAKKIVENRKNPLIITYRVNSAGMSSDHWINDPIEGGGAIIGEGCHFFDFCNWIINKDPQRIYAEMISTDNSTIVDNNNLISTIKYVDGSIASVIYSTIGNESFSKERIEIFCEGTVISIDDFKKIDISGFKKEEEKLIDKGHYEILESYGKLLSGKNENNDIPTVEDGINATICSLKTLESLKTGKTQIW